jgi:hypothetical protein
VPEGDAGEATVVVYHPDDAPAALSIAVNHGPVRRVVRGWPLIARASVALRREVPGGLPVTPFVLTASAAGRAALTGELVEVAAEEALTPLTRDHLRARRVYVASSTATRGLPLGMLSLRLQVGEARRTVEVEVVDPPQGGGRGDRIEEAVTRFDEHSLRGEHQAALDAVLAAQDQGKTDLLLLALEARALLALGRTREALARVDLAILRFGTDTAEPPEGLYELKQEIEAQLRGGR